MLSGLKAFTDCPAGVRLGSVIAFMCLRAVLGSSTTAKASK